MHALKQTEPMECDYTLPDITHCIYNFGNLLPTSIESEVHAYELKKIMKNLENLDILCRSKTI